jgi:hypothetical protein
MHKKSHVGNEYCTTPPPQRKGKVLINAAIQAMPTQTLHANF